MRRTFEDLVAEADSASVDGWDFSWFEGRAIQYYHFGPSAVQPSALYRVAGGGVVLSSLPGTAGYSALRQVFDVEISPSAGINPREVTSRGVILRLLETGRARLRATGLILNLPIVPDGMQNTLACFTWPVCQRRYCSSVNSCAPPPVPRITPIWRFSSCDMACGSSPASAIASAEAATANGTDRETCLRSRASTHANSSKP